MKSAYELAMERLEKEQGPSVELSKEQKKRIADVDSRCKAEEAEIQLAFEPRIAEARQSGDAATLEELEAEKRRRMDKAREDAESARQAIRSGE